MSETGVQQLSIRLQAKI